MSNLFYRKVKDWMDRELVIIYEDLKQPILILDKFNIAELLQEWNRKLKDE